MLRQFDVQEDDNARNVVHDAFFFSLPPQIALLDYSLGRFLRIFGFKEGFYDLGNVVVGEEFPDAVRGNHNKFVVFAEVQLENFRFSRDTHSRSHLVAKRSSHGQPGDVFVFEPDAQRTDRVLIRVSKGVDSAATLQNARRFVALARFLVATNCL